MNGILFAIIKNDNEMLKQSHAHQVISKVLYMRVVLTHLTYHFSLKPGTKRIMDGLSERVCLQVHTTMGWPYTAYDTASAFSQEVCCVLG